MWFGFAVNLLAVLAIANTPRARHEAGLFAICDLQSRAPRAGVLSHVPGIANYASPF